jgi:hypothetical protein
MIELLQAFLEAKKGFEKPKKSKKSNHGDYSTVEDINDATQPALQANNLVIIPSVRDDILTVRLYHTLTGQFLEDVRKLVSEKSGCQGIGASNTYMLKYALKTILNISGNDDDDDGQAEQAYIEKQKKEEQDYINKQVIKKKETELADLLINVKEHLLKNKYLADITKEKFNIDFTSDSLHRVEKSKLDEVVKFIKSR